MNILRSRLGLAVAAAVVIGSVGIFGASRLFAAPPRAELRTQPVQRSNVTQTVAVSGAVNPSSLVRLSFKSAGRLAALLVTVGQNVNAGDVLAKLDDADQQIAVQQAAANLASAQAKYQNTLTGDDVAALRVSADNAQRSLDRLVANYNAAKTNLDLLLDSARMDRITAGNFFDSAQTHLRALQDDLTHLQLFADGKAASASANAVLGNVGQAALQFSLVDNAFADVANMTGAIKAQTGRYDTGASDATTYALVQASYSSAITRAQNALDATNAILSQALMNANAVVATFTTTEIVGDYFLNQARPEASALVADLGTAQARLQLAKAKLGSLPGGLGAITDAITGSSLLGAQNVVASAKQALQAKLDSRDSDVQAALAAVQSAQASYDSAKNALANMSLGAPIGGVVAQVSGNVGEFVSGSATTPFILLTATTGLALHGTVGEADVARLKLGQVATITIDAIGTDKRLTGKVTSLDPVATIQQGVPVYGVDVTLDLSDPAIRAGMSGTANVITASKRDVLVVPNIAIRNLSGRRGVQVLRDGQPVDVTDVQFGISNEQVTEVTSGLAEGDLAVLPSARTGATPQIRFGGPPPGGGGAPGGGPPR